MKANGLNFNVKVKGEGEAVVWGHGLASSIISEDLLDIFEWDKLSKEAMLVRYDARGHGQSESSFSPSDYHWKNLAKDMVSIADGLKISKFIAGGQSMGCATTLYASILAPKRIKGMILMNPPTAWETRAEQSHFYNRTAMIGGLLGGNILAKVVKRKPERLLPKWLVDVKRENVEGILEGIKPIKRKSLSCIFKGAALTDLPSEEEIKSINIPALILAWTGDRSHPIETAKKLNELMPQAELHIAEGFSDLQNWPSKIRNFVAT